MIRPGAMLYEVLRHLTKKVATVFYPFIKIEMADKFRGKLNFHSENCIGCKMCMRDCPANAINIIKIGDKKFECEIYLEKCIYCAQCVYVCPKKALESTKEFELAQLDKNKFKVRFSNAAVEKNIQGES